MVVNLVIVEPLEKLEEFGWGRIVDLELNEFSQYFRACSIMLAVAILNQNQHVQRQFEPGCVNVGSCAEQLGLDGWLISDSHVAPRQLEINWESGRNAVEVTNHGRSLALSSGPRIHRGRMVELTLPVSFCVGDTQVQIFDDEAEHPLDFGLTHRSLGNTFHQTDEDSRKISPGAATLAAWLESLSDLQRATAGSHELFQIAAKAIFNPGGLDGAMVLLPKGDHWEVAASHIPYPDHGIGFRNDLVCRSAETSETIFHDATVTDCEPSVSDFHCAVVCPVIGDDEQVVAAVYGFRSLHRRNSRRGIRPLEAQFVQVVADALSGGMVRLESEAKAARSKVILEQAFPPSVARQLQSNPQFLEPQTRDVSILFADLRGFSSISERIGTRDSYQLLSDVMDRFSDIISDLDGVIIDFYGDGLSAFWNAPIEQPEHALLACQAGFELINCLPDIDKIWASRIGESLRVGIGIHSGPARVGNSGSRRRIKYGPRGSTVNLASRLENVTKRIGVPMLVSASTADQVQSAFQSQRIIQWSLDGIRTPTDLCRLIPRNDVQDTEYFDLYESALQHFENDESEPALSILSELNQYPEDAGVAKFLVGEIERCLESERAQNFDR